MASIEHTRKSLATQIREGAAKAGDRIEPAMVGGLLRYVINGETLTPGEAAAKYGATYGG